MFCRHPRIKKNVLHEIIMSGITPMRTELFIVSVFFFNVFVLEHRSDLKHSVGLCASVGRREERRGFTSGPEAKVESPNGESKFNITKEDFMKDTPGASL